MEKPWDEPRPRRLPQTEKPIRLHLLGQTNIFVGDQPFKLGLPHKTLPLLGYTILHRAGPVLRGRAAFRLWPDDSEEEALGKLRRTIYLLTRALPPAPPEQPWLLVDTVRLQWNPGAPAWIDVDAFERLAADPATYEAAAETYGGDLLPEMYDEWVIAERERFRSRYFQVLMESIARYRQARNYPAAMDFAQRILAGDPWREDIVRSLMTLRYESGDRAGALADFERFSQRLKAELHVSPMAETLALREAIANARTLADLERRRPSATSPSGGAGISGGADVPNGASETLAAPRSRLPFVGRDAEMARLGTYWNRAIQGRGMLVLLGGEAGIGKTRLATEFAHIVADGGGRVMHGATGDRESVPYQNLADAFRSVLPIVESLHVDRLWLAVLAQLVPELRQRRPGLPALPALDPEREQLRLFEACATILGALARERPTYLLLEDLHAAGEATIDALAFLARRVATLPVLIVATYREEETQRTHPLRRLRRRLQEAGQITYLSPARLVRRDVERIAAHAPLEQARIEPLAERLFEQSEGNPLYLVELLRDLIESGPPAGAVALERPPVRAGGIESTIAARMTRLSPNARALAEVAATLGLEFDVEAAREVGGWPESQTLDALEELLDRSLVMEAGPRSRFAYTFTHRLVQATIYAGIDERDRARRHRRIARVLEDIYAPPGDDLTLDIARHYDLGGRRDPAARYYLRAARRALELAANGEAKALAERALELTAEPETRTAALLVCERAGARIGDREARRAALAQLAALPEFERDRELAFEVLGRRIELARSLGDRAEEARAIAALRERAERTGSRRHLAAANNAEGRYALRTGKPAEAGRCARAALELATGYEASEALALLAEIAAEKGDLGEARAFLERMREAAGTPGGNRELTARITLQTAQATQLERNYAEALALSAQARDIYRELGDRDGEANATTRLGHCLAQLGRVADARANFESAAATFRSIGERAGLAHLLIDLGHFEMEQGRIVRAQAALDEAERLNEELGNVRGQEICAINRSFYLLRAGDPQGALAAGEYALTLARNLGHRPLEAVALGNYAAAERDLGAIDRAIAHLHEAIALHEAARRPASAQEDRTELALALVQAGRIEEARALGRILDDGEIDRSTWPQVRHWALAEIARASGDAAARQTHLHAAGDHVRTVAGTIADDAEREAFLAAPVNRAILAQLRGITVLYPRPGTSPSPEPPTWPPSPEPPT
jgi:DNA-binding SARP family transcriptional activator